MNKEEFIAKLKEAKSADEILALAKESGVELDEVAGGSGFMDMLSRGLDQYHKQHPHV